MSEREASAHATTEKTAAQRVKRRGILAATGALVAGIMAKQIAEPVVAAGANGNSDGGALIIGAPGTTSGDNPNETNQETRLVASVGGPLAKGASLLFVDAGLRTGNVTGIQALGSNSSGTGGKGVFAEGGTPVGNTADGGPGIVGIGGSAAGAGKDGSGVIGGEAGIGVNGVLPAGVQGIGKGRGVFGTVQNSTGVGVQGASDSLTPLIIRAGVHGVSKQTGVQGEIVSTGAVANSVAVKGINQSTATGAIGVFGQCDAASGIGGLFQGGLAPLQLTPAASGTGAPATGTHGAGELYVDSAGALFYCTAPGIPGTWINLSASTGGVTGITAPGGTASGAVTLVAGSNITLTEAADTITIAATSGGGGVTGITAPGGTATGAVTLAAGDNITLTESVNTITIAAVSGGGSGGVTGITAPGGTATGAVTLAAGNNVTITEAANTITIAATANGSGPAGPVFTLLPTPERFVDTRSNLGGLKGPIPPGTTHTFQMTGRNGQSGNAALVIPDTATALVGNLTVIGAAGIPLGSFVTLWPGGPQPTVSNINFGPGDVTGAVANSFAVGLSASGGHGTVRVFNLSRCDYLLDVTGYYT